MINKTAIAYAMIKFGGSFAAALGHAYLCADFDNAEKIETAFPELIEQYANMAHMVAEEEKG